MVKTLLSMLISLALLIGASIFEQRYVHNAFLRFTRVMQVLYDKTEKGTVTDEDGRAVCVYWEEQKKDLQIWLPHATLQEVDYQLYEAVGFIYVEDFQSALPKIEVVLGMCENIPYSYTLHIENTL
jgi:hypothetical protein